MKIFYFWCEHEARTLELISGSYDQSEMNFINLQYTFYINEVTDEWYVLRGENTDDNNSHFKYVVLKHKSEFFRSSASSM